MDYILRFTCSGLLGLCITVALIFGMINLLGLNYNPNNSGDLNFRISYVNTEIETKQKKRIVKKLPEPEKSSEPPAPPRLNLPQDDQAMLNLPNNFDHGKNLHVLNKINLPGINMNVGGVDIDSQGGVKAGIPPIYPPKALFKDIEGWVQVSIAVSASGHVNEVTVMKSEPVGLFDEAALKAVIKWSFYQKKVLGNPVPYQFIQTIEFKVDQPVELD